VYFVSMVSCPKETRGINSNRIWSFFILLIIN
jgi:hypothetical protein